MIYVLTVRRVFGFENEKKGLKKPLLRAENWGGKRGG